MALILSGSVTGTRNIELALPDYYNNEKSASGTIHIGAIEDKRIFLEDSGEPSTPSVDGDLDSTSKEKLYTLIGRQRNTWGHAMGDVSLPDGGTVQEEIRRLMTRRLESRGYKVVNDSNSSKKDDYR